MKAILQFFLIAYLSSSVSFADKIVVLDKANHSLAARVHFLLNAQKSIDAQYFSINNDRVSLTGLALLKNAAKRNVKVRLLVDSMHNQMPPDLMAAFLNNLEPQYSKNIEIKEFNPFNLFRPFCYTHRMHDKSINIDGKYLIVGDRNVGNGYYDFPDLNTVTNKTLPMYQGVDVLLEGQKAVSDAQKYFEARWHSKEARTVNLHQYSAENLETSQCFYKIDASCDMRVELNQNKVKKQMQNLDETFALFQKNISEVTESMQLDWFKNAYETSDVQFIHDQVSKVCAGKTAENIGAKLYKTIEENTTKSLFITTPYLIVTEETLELIKKLIDKDVTVKIITNSLHSNDVPEAHAGYLATRDRLLSIKNNKTGNRVKIYEYTNYVLKNLDATNTLVGSIDTLHSKVVLMDNKKVFIGSYNWDYRSQNINSEIGVVIGLEDTNKEAPRSLIRSRLASYLKHSKLVRIDGTLDEAHSIESDFTEFEKMQFLDIIQTRKDSVKLWQNLLNVPVLGEILKKQL